MSKIIAAAEAARNASDAISAELVGRAISDRDWLRIYLIETEAADACKKAARVSNPDWYKAQWREAANLHTAFAEAAATHL